MATLTASPSAAVEPEPRARAHSTAGREREEASPQRRDPDRYEIICEHGRGGLGRVSRAYDRELGRDVAIKELLSRGNLSEVRFLREALITARLEHPGIVPVHEAGRWPNGTPFYAMKLVSGRPLRDLIAERTTVEARIGLLHHVIAIADAIAYAHGRNIIHRDLKPANVIVGEFGETVVIDWGLAKDLSTTSEPATADRGPFRTLPDAGLTSAGSVLGTPTYMSPEQERGDPVDQRADVFAIGAMLWELCSLQKVAPVDQELRRRVLRRAGIDEDLITIVNKSLQSEPAHRYANAAELAADLKSFKAGIRIAARSYSAFAMVAHWTRRHRAITLTAAAAILIALASIAVYVHDIAIARDRAEAANDKLTLEHAALLLPSDPTAAAAVLAGYQGSDVLRLRRLQAEARGRGEATGIFSPDTDTVWFVLGAPSGEIISLGQDQMIVATRDGHSTTIASDVSIGVRMAYAPSTGLLAYATTPDGIAILDLKTKQIRKISTDNSRSLAFSPDGLELAVANHHDQLVIWSLAAAPRPIYRVTAPDILDISLASARRVYLRDQTSIKAIALDGAGSSATWTSAGITSFDAQPEIVVAGDATGNITVLSSELVPITSYPACHKRLNAVRIIPATSDISYACADSVFGILRYNNNTRTVESIDTLETHGSTHATPSPSGRYIGITDESLTAYLYDTKTGITAHYDGNAGIATAIAAPTPDASYILIGYSNGTIRRWRAPTSAARVVQQLPVPIFWLSFSRDSRQLIANGADRKLYVTDVASATTEVLRGHEAGVRFTRVAPDGASMLSYGYDGTVRVWSASSHLALRVFADHASVVNEAEYIEGGRRIASIGDDGRLRIWSPAGNDTVVRFSHPSPLVSLEVLNASQHLVVADKAGEVWDVAPDGRAHQVRRPDGQTITVLRASTDGNQLAIGTNSAIVTIYDTATWRVINFSISSGSILQIEFDPRGRDLLVAAEAGVSSIRRVQWIPLRTGQTPHWSTVAMPIRVLSYAEDGEAMGFVCSDGGTWLYARRTNLWSYTRDHASAANAGVFSPDGKLFASSDHGGRLVIRDVASTLTDATLEGGMNHENDRK